MYKHQKVGEKVAATEILYARAMELQGRFSDLEIKSLMKYELVFHPPLLLINDGQMWECTSKTI
jgi:hypothetical protein